MDWIANLTVDEARATMRRLWRERDEAIVASDYDEVERLNALMAAVSSQIGKLGGDVG